jgi:hypothetical protein
VRRDTALPLPTYNNKLMVYSQGKGVLAPKHSPMKLYRGTEVKLQVFNISALDGGEWSASRSSRFAHEKRILDTDRIQGRVRNWRLCQESKTSTVWWSWGDHCCDWAVTTRSSVDVRRRFGGTCHLHLQGRNQQQTGACVLLVRRSTDVSTQLQVTLATDCRALICFMNASCEVDHERASSILFRCIVSVLWVMIIFRHAYVKSSIFYLYI